MGFVYFPAGPLATHCSDGARSSGDSLSCHHVRIRRPCSPPEGVPQARRAGLLPSSFSGFRSSLLPHPSPRLCCHCCISHPTHPQRRQCPRLVGPHSVRNITVRQSYTWPPQCHRLAILQPQNTLWLLSSTETDGCGFANAPQLLSSTAPQRASGAHTSGGTVIIKRGVVSRKRHSLRLSHREVQVPGGPELSLETVQDGGGLPVTCLLEPQAAAWATGILTPCTVGRVGPVKE